MPINDCELRINSIWDLDVEMTIKDEQCELRQQNFWGIPGIFVSGIVWLISGIVCISVSESYAIAALFIGGMAIYPVSALVCKMILSLDPPSSENSLNFLGLESTAILFMGLFLAFIGRAQSPGYFFHTMLMTIGVRYLLFQTVYGARVYWILGLTLSFAGLALFILRNNWVPLGGLAGGIIEIGFATYMIGTFKTKSDTRV